jgi:hypothetical protein
MFRGLFRLRRSEMIIAIDLIPGTEPFDKDRFTYPTFEPTPLSSFASWREIGNWILVRLRLTAKR